jgi:hypothetical protein
MKILDTSNTYNSLYHYTTRLLGLPSDDTTTISTSEYVNSLNVWLRNTAERIWRNQNYWKYDDNNHDDMAEATTDLVADQQDYALDTTIYDITSVTVKDANGDYKKLEPLTYQDKGYAEQEFLETAGMPVYYKLRGNVISLFPKPSAGDVTTTDGLVLQVSRDIDGITITSTSMAQEPGIPRQFHDLLGIGIAQDQSIRLGLNDKWQQLTLMLNNKNKDLETHYSLRNKDNKTKIRPTIRQSL